MPAKRRPVRDPSRRRSSTLSREDEIKAISDPEKNPDNNKVKRIATVSKMVVFSC